MKKILLTILVAFLISTPLLSAQIVYAADDVPFGQNGVAAPEELEIEVIPEGMVFEKDGNYYINAGDEGVYSISESGVFKTDLTMEAAYADAESGEGGPVKAVGIYTEEGGWEPNVEETTMPGFGLAEGEKAAAQAPPSSEEFYEGLTEEEPSAPSQPKSLKETKFNVREILSLDEEVQPQKYFEEDGETPIVAFILSIINFALRIIGSIAIIILIIGGFMFMFAQGNQQKLDEAKDVVKYAIIGLLVTFLSYIIVITVQSLFISEGETETPTTEESQ
ncbi:hypothetical protein GF366_03350 [Candidatus Peregrinibacteria bacterium]|nr:hypothetical protein [Candidatus Peregrinibacteria bacterium]